MAPYFSAAWCAAAVKAFNDDPDAAEALEGWRGDVGLFADDVGVWLAAPVNDRLAQAQLMPVAELEAKAPTSTAKASLQTWAELIEGRLDPIAAVVQKRLMLKGDVHQIASRMGYRGLAERWLSAIRGGA